MFVAPLGAAFNDLFHVAPLGTNNFPSHFEFFIICYLYFIAACVFDIGKLLSLFYTVFSIFHILDSSEIYFERDVSNGPFV